MNAKEFESDLNVLRTHSGYAYAYGKTHNPKTDKIEISCTIGEKLWDDCDFQTLLSIFDWTTGHAEPDDTFHPVDAGCIKLDDDYLFDIRCDHLVWIDFDSYQENARRTLLIGNHKGQTHFRVIQYNEPLSDED